MRIIKENIAWFAPTVAIMVLGVGLLKSDGVFSFFGADTNEQAEAAENSRVTALNSTVLAALEASNRAASEQDAEDEAMEVSRNAPLDLVQLTSEATEPTPEPVTVAAFDPSGAAEFFTTAQANLAANDQCQNDLASLAASAKVYFPTGGLSAEDAGLSSVRLIGLVAADCPGLTIQVEGHSDPSGDPVINQALSERRAEAVIARLAASGIDTSKFVAVGYGDTKPSNLRGTQSPAYYDRRVEFSVVQTAQRVSFNTSAQPWQTPSAECVSELESKAARIRHFYEPRSITAASNEMAEVYDLAAAVENCEGAWLRIIGQHSDEPSSRETVSTGRLRALAVLSSLVSAGFSQDHLLIAAPSYSVDIAGQPGLPNSRVEFQVVSN